MQVIHSIDFWAEHLSLWEFIAIAWYCCVVFQVALKNAVFKYTDWWILPVKGLDSKKYST